MNAIEQSKSEYDEILSVLLTANSLCKIIADSFEAIMPKGDDDPFELIDIKYSIDYLFRIITDYQDCITYSLCKHNDLHSGYMGAYYLLVTITSAVENANDKNEDSPYKLEAIQESLWIFNKMLAIFIDKYSKMEKEIVDTLYSISSEGSQETLKKSMNQED